MSSSMKKAQHSAYLTRISDCFSLVMNQNFCILLVVSPRGSYRFSRKNEDWQNGGKLDIKKFKLWYPFQDNIFWPD